eukprot:5159815-Amphidinium_carterae.1
MVAKHQFTTNNSNIDDSMIVDGDIDSETYTTDKDCVDNSDLTMSPAKTFATSRNFRNFG